MIVPLSADSRGPEHDCSDYGGQKPSVVARQFGGRPDIGHIERVDGLWTIHPSTLALRMQRTEKSAKYTTVQMKESEIQGSVIAVDLQINEVWIQAP